jgi:uncharacterized damage-inducible protein DinB
MDDLRYPVGKFRFDGEVTDARRRGWIDEIEATPARLRAAVARLSAAQFDTAYRPGGWTVRQVVHHLPDSHLNAYTRFKLALTEDTPTIKPYDEARWAELPDGRSGPIEPSLALLDAVHQRWVLLLRQLSADQFARAFFHPEHGRALTLNEVLALYAWHGRHHVAHITALRQRMRWD